MPYIQQRSRDELDLGIDQILNRLGLTDQGGIQYCVGELNYVFTRLLVEALGPNPHYADINAAIGVLECAKQELYRRVAAPYEDAKRAENGEVYW